ncbi:MAG TPA: hydrogenase, partial [Spirochaetia bacterium]|nr:hydrogenase [Spirochaetia bacterium]
VEPLLGFIPSVVLGAAGTAAAFFFYNRFVPQHTDAAAMIIPSAISTIFVGFIILTTRYKAITQVIGYLILENGIFIFSMLLLVAIPMVIEMGMLLDLFVSVFVISIITNHINRAFSSLDTRRKNTLKE